LKRREHSKKSRKLVTVEMLDRFINNTLYAISH